MNNLRSLPLFVLASAFLCSAAALAQQAPSAVRIIDKIDESNLVTLKGNTHPAAIAKNDRGAVSSAFALPDLTLVLSRSPEQQAAFDAFVASQYESGSPNFHQWLTPAQIGAQFGPAPADIATITGWLSSHGFTVKQVAPDGMTIRFSGTAAQVESAFHTEIHNLSVNGKPHYANMSDPQIPAALAPVIVGVKALHNFLPRPLHRMGSKVQFNKAAGKWQRITNTAAASSATPGSAPRLAKSGAASNPALSPRPQFGINGNCGTDCTYLEEDVTPWDFAKIYNLPSGWPTTTSANGSGQTIAIAGTSEIDLNDVTTYRSAFDLPAGLTPIEIDTGDGPAATVCNSTSPSAVCGIGDLEENTLDVEASGAVATGAQIKLVVTGQNADGTIDTVYDSASYVVQNLAGKVLSVSYGECELGQGTAENVAYYDLWQSAASEGISVFVAAGDSGSPSCDDGQDGNYGNPYVAQYGLSVSGLASSPYDTAVGGTDFSWCQPYFNSSGDYEGCPSSSTSQGSPAYWATSNNATTGASALGYVPEIPWNDTCMNPIWARYLVSDFGFSGDTTPEEMCNNLYENWETYDEEYEQYYDTDPYFEYFVDTVGGSGGASNCVVNSTDSESFGTCSTGANTTGTANGSIPLTKDGWPSPSWQAQSGVTGTSGLTQRAIPDVSFFAGDGALGSATLICLSAEESCALSDTVDNTAQEVGGTSVGSPEMAGVMALINQKAGAAQGLANPGLYSLAANQTYSECSAESVTNSSNCKFQDIDYGPTAASGSPAYTTTQTNSMPCNLTGTEEGGDGGGPYTGTTSPNCAAINSGDTLGTLVTTTSSPTAADAAYNSGTGYDLATGLGSLNVANIVNAWVSDAGTASTTLGVKLNPTGTISADTALAITVTVTGSGSLAAPSGSIVVAGGGYSATGTLTTVTPATTPASSSVTITIPASSLSPGSVTLTITYGGDSNYAENSTTQGVTVSAVNPTVTVTAPSSSNYSNALSVTVTVSGPVGVPTPTGTVTLAGGGYGPTPAETLNSSGYYTFTIPVDTLAAGSDTLTANYSGNTDYASGSGSATVDIVTTVPATPVITVTPTPTSIDSSQTLSVGVTVASQSGAPPTPTGSVTLTAGSYTSTMPLTGAGTASFTVPVNSLAGSASGETDTITANYLGDANYASGTKNASETVTESTLGSTPLTPGTPSPSTVTPPGTDTVTISGNPSATFYTGTVTFGSSSCALTTSPSGASTSVLPTCTGSGTITYTNGTPSGNGTATVTTYSVTTGAMIRPKFGSGKGWLGAGSGAVLALVFFFGIPKRRRSWRKMLCILGAFVALGVLSSCGGGGGGGVTTTTTSTTAGSYTFTLTGTASPAVPTAPSTTFTITVN